MNEPEMMKEILRTVTRTNNPETIAKYFIGEFENLLTKKREDVTTVFCQFVEIGRAYDVFAPVVAYIEYVLRHILEHKNDHSILNDFIRLTQSRLQHIVAIYEYMDETGGDPFTAKWEAKTR